MAILLFWCVALYVCVTGFYSITMQVFWPEQVAWDAGCADGIRTLLSELDAKASEQVAGAGLTTDEHELRRWLRDWDARHATLRDRCTGEERKAHRALAELRQRVETMLRRERHEHAPLVREIERDLPNEDSHPL